MKRKRDIFAQIRMWLFLYFLAFCVLTLLGIPQLILENFDIDSHTTQQAILMEIGLAMGVLLFSNQTWEAFKTGQVPLLYRHSKQPRPSHYSKINAPKKYWAVVVCYLLLISTIIFVQYLVFVKF